MARRDAPAGARRPARRLGVERSPPRAGTTRTHARAGWRPPPAAASIEPGMGERTEVAGAAVTAVPAAHVRRHHPLAPRGPHGREAARGVDARVRSPGDRPPRLRR